MKKRGWLSLCLTVTMILGILPQWAAHAQETVKYNYKLTMDSESAFKSVITFGGNGYKGITKSFNTAGKYGTCLQYTCPGYRISDSGQRYNVCALNFKDEEISLGDETLTIGQIVGDTNEISMWVKTPYTDRTAHRTIEMQIQTDKNKYKKQFQVPNTGEWSYITLPISAFEGLKEACAAGEEPTVLQFISPYFSYFGAEPEARVDDEGAEPWIEPLCIDELVFDRSAEGVRTVTPPSKGEETYYENTGLKTVTVDGKPVRGFDKSLSVNEIPVPANMTPELLAQRVAAVVEAPDIPKSSVNQAVSGATYTLQPPKQIPGEGTITVQSASRQSKKVYSLSFTVRDSFQVIRDEITGVSETAGLPQGNTVVNVPVKNESGTVSYHARGVLIARNPDNEAAEAAALSDEITVGPGEKVSFAFELDTPMSGCRAELYFLDLDRELELITDPEAVPYEDLIYQKTSGALSSASVSYQDEKNLATVSGTLQGAQERDSVLIYLRSGETPVDLFCVASAEGAFSKEITLPDSVSGDIEVLVAAGGKISRQSFYCSTEKEREACVREFPAKTAGKDVCLSYYNTYEKALNIPAELSQRLTDQQKAEAVLMAAGAKKDLASIKQAVGESVVVQVVNKEQTKETLAQMYESYNHLARFDESRNFFQKYIKTDERRLEIFSYMCKESYKDAEQMRKAFLEYGLLVSLNHIAVYNEIGTLIKENEDILSEYLDYDALEKLGSNLPGYYQYVANHLPLASLEKLQGLLKDYEDTLKRPAAKPGGGAGGSGGGGSRPAVKTSTPIVAQPVATNPPADQHQTDSPVFEDLPQGHWAYEPVMALHKLGIVNGRDAHVFAGDETVTREEFVKMLCGVFGLQTGEVECNFTDVDRTMWYAPYICAAVRENIVSGVSHEQFGVGREVTRQEMAVMMARGLSQAGMSLEAAPDILFDDEEMIADYAKDSVHALKHAGLIDGMGDNRFMPEETATRAQAAKLLYSVYGYLSR